MCFMAVLLGVLAPFRNLSLRKTNHKITVKTRVYIAYETLFRQFLNTVPDNSHTIFDLPKLKTALSKQHE